MIYDICTKEKSEEKKIYFEGKEESRQSYWKFASERRNGCQQR